MREAGERVKRAVILVMAAGVGVRAADPIRTPFELVPLWSEEMMLHMAGQLQPACVAV